MSQRLMAFIQAGAKPVAKKASKVQPSVCGMHRVCVQLLSIDAKRPDYVYRSVYMREREREREREPERDREGQRERGR